MALVAYITAEYYNDDYHGAPVPDAATLTRYLESASALIDGLTHYALVQSGIDALPVFVSDRVKKATAAQVDAFARGGGDNSLTLPNASAASYGIGTFNVTAGAASAKQSARSALDAVPPLVYSYLGPTGLLFSGVAVK